MNGPTSVPAGERPGRPGTTWESWVAWTEETWVPDPDTSTDPPPRTPANASQPPPIPNRATRRALARAARRKTT